MLRAELIDNVLHFAVSDELKLKSIQNEESIPEELATSRAIAIWCCGRARL